MDNSFVENTHRRRKNCTERKEKKSQYEEGVAKTHTRMPHHVFMPISMNKEEERKSTYTHKEKKQDNGFLL